jgi:ATP-dependent helicase YprA (DUF1998 family)
MNEAIDKMPEKTEKTEQKALDKAEAERRGISYKEVKEERKKKTKREAGALDTSDHEREVKRLRTYSKDFDNDTTGRRSTRSVDIKEEKDVKAAADISMTPSEWRKEHSICIEGHGKESGKKDVDFADPYREFSDTPFSESILKSFQTAGFERPTPIQSQAWPFALQQKDLICVAKTGSGKTCGFLLPFFQRSFQV